MITSMTGVDLGILPGGGGGLGRNSSRGGLGPGPQEFSYTDKQKRTSEGGLNPLTTPHPGSATAGNQYMEVFCSYIAALG